MSDPIPLPVQAAPVMVELLVNDPERGTPTGRCIHVRLRLDPFIYELERDPLDEGVKFALRRDQFTLDGVTYPLARPQVAHPASWAWDGLWVEEGVAADLLLDLAQGGGWRPERTRA